MSPLRNVTVCYFFLKQIDLLRINQWGQNEVQDHPKTTKTVHGNQKRAKFWFRTHGLWVLRLFALPRKIFVFANSNLICVMLKCSTRSGVVKTDQTFSLNFCVRKLTCERLNNSIYRFSALYTIYMTRFNL